MAKNTVTGSFLAKLFPTFSKNFLESASQDEVNKAEQEAAVIHQQIHALGETGSDAVAAATGTPDRDVSDGIRTGGPVEAVTAAPVISAADLTAMTTRATTAEATVADLTSKLTMAEQDRDRYKAWFDKQSGKGTALPGADATTRGAAGEGPTLSVASADALAAFKKKQAKA